MSRKNFVRVITTVITTIFIIINGISAIPAEAATAPGYESGASISTQASGAAALPNAWVSCYAISNGRVNTYTASGNYTGYIDGAKDLCKVNFQKISNGRVYCIYPTSTGSKGAYTAASNFIYSTGYNRYTGNLSNNVPVYTKINSSQQIGTAYKTDTVIVVSVSGNKAQIIYPVSGGAYKMGWVNLNSSKSYDPQGWFDHAVAKNGGVEVRGWSFDRNALSSSVTIDVYINNIKVKTITANTQRNDVNTAYPGVGCYHGFLATIPTNLTGNVSVTCYANNIGAGQRKCLGTKMVDIPKKQNNMPQGYFDSLTCSDDGTLRVDGWSADRDTTASIWNHVYIDGKYAFAVQSGKVYRPDVPKVYSYFGNYTGFSGTYKTNKTGTIRVDIYAIDSSGGTNPLIGSKTITVKNSSSGSFQWPVSNYYVCGNNWSEYYSARNGDHLGVDIKSSTGDTNVYAAASGIVRQSGWNDANGYCVVIEHNVNGRKFYTFYGHLSSRSVSVGTSVSKGTKIGVIGNTGSSSKGAHLHFAVTTQNSTGTWGYSRNSTFANNANSTTWSGYTFYNPYYVIQNGRLP